MLNLKSEYKDKICVKNIIKKFTQDPKQNPDPKPTEK